MKAFTKNIYGGPEVLSLEEVLQPELQASDEMLVKVYANSANPADWRLLQNVLL